MKATNNKQTGLVTNKFGQFILIFMIQEITKYLELLLLCSLRSQSELTATNNKQTGLLCVVLSGTQSWNDFKMNLSIKCLIGKLSNQRHTSSLLNLLYIHWTCDFQMEMSLSLKAFPSVGDHSASLVWKELQQWVPVQVSVWTNSNFDTNTNTNNKR